MAGNEETTGFGLLLRKALTRDEVGSGLAALLKLQPTEVLSYDDPRAIPDTPVTFNMVERTGSFRTDLTVYIGARVVPPTGSAAQFALLTAKHFKTDVITDFPDELENPYVWLLVRADGSTFRASEILSDDDHENITLNESPSDLVPWSPTSGR